MDTLIAKLLFALGYLVPIIAIRGPHIKAKKTQTFRQDRKVGSDTAAFVLTTVGNAFVPLLFIVSPVFWFADYESPLWAGIVGAVLLIPGHWFFYRSHRDLGENWSPVLEVREGHTLVTGGIYRRIRHPMYTSVWLFVIAQALLLPNWIAGFGGLIPFTFLYFLRVGKEERLMLEEFGDEYAEYRKGTGRLFPKL